MQHKHTLAILAVVWFAGSLSLWCEVDRENLEVIDLSRRIDKLMQTATRSPQFRSGIHDGIPFSDQVLLRPSNTKENAATTTVSRWVDQGLAAASIPSGLVEAHILRSENGQLDRVRFRLPDMPLGSDRSRKKISITVWSCDSREAAVALLWVRRGGSMPQDAVQDLRLGAGTSLWSEGEDSNYRFHNLTSVALPEGNPRAGSDRIGFLRGNVLVEATGSTFVLNSDGHWASRGMTKQDETFLWNLLSEIRSSITSVH